MERWNLTASEWNKGKFIEGGFELIFLPPYSPDLNPIEHLRLLMKAEWFSDFIAKTQDDLINQLINMTLSKIVVTTPRCWPTTDPFKEWAMSSKNGEKPPKNIHGGAGLRAGWSGSLNGL